jgi:hypothetical protein
MIWCRRRYPLFRDVQRRLIVQSVIMFLYTIIGNNLLGYIMDDLVFHDKDLSHFRYEILIGSNSAAIFCTIMIIAIYESVYFKNELRKSVEEKEMLKRESLKAQLSALKTQVNPHFLFNNLNTLSHLKIRSWRWILYSSSTKAYIEVKDEQSILLKEGWMY